MNDIKTIEELRMYHERLKEVVTALQRLEEGTNQSDKPPQVQAFNPERNERNGLHWALQYFGKRLLR